MLCLPIAAVMLTACSAAHGEYITLSEGLPVESATEKRIPSDILGEPLCSVSEDFGIDLPARWCVVDSWTYTLDGNYLYWFGNIDGIGMIKTDLQSGKSEPLCTAPGCAHDTPSCINNRAIHNVRAVGNEILYTDGERLMSFKDGEHTVLFTNELSHDIESFAGAYGDPAAEERARRSINYIPTEDTLYVNVGNLVYTLDRETLTAGKPVKVGDNAVWSMCAHDGGLYVTNDVNELFRVDFETETAEKLAEKVIYPIVYDEKLYYVKWQDDVPWLCGAELDGSGEELLIEDCYVYFVIKYGNVFYSQFAQDMAFYMRPLDGGEKTKLSDANAFCIFTAPHIDRVFIVDSAMESWRSDGSGYMLLAGEKEEAE